MFWMAMPYSHGKTYESVFMIKKILPRLPSTCVLKQNNPLSAFNNILYAKNINAGNR